MTAIPEPVHEPHRPVARAPGPIRVGLIGGLRPYREALLRQLAAQDGIDPSDLGNDESALRTALANGHADVIVVDLPAHRLHEILLNAASLAPPAQIVAINMTAGVEEQIELLEAGLTGALPPTASLEEVVDVVAEAGRGEARFSSVLAGHLVRRLQALARAARRRPGMPSLTAREMQVLELVREGCSNKEIASRLVVEPATVKNHVHNILKKLGVTRRWEAVLIVWRDDVDPRRPFTRGGLAAEARDRAWDDEGQEGSSGD